MAQAMTPASRSVTATPAAEPTARARLRHARPLIIIGVAVVATAFLLALVADRRSAGRLDPAAADPAGSRALAELLRAEGVEIVSVETYERAAAEVDESSTLFVTVPDRLPAGRLSALSANAGTVVLVEPTTSAFERLLPGMSAVGTADVASREPGCPLRAAQVAGSVDAGGITYEATGADAQCYAVGGRPTLVRSSSDGTPVTIVGMADPFMNERLDEAGNAALTMWLLGEHPRLVWYRPAVSDALETGDADLIDLLPRGWKWAGAQLCLAVVLVALWRARRLGPVVTEPLPVVVPAAETAEGRAQLYRRVRARDRAAEALREGTRARLRQPLGLPRGADAHALVEAVARRTGSSEVAVRALLFGAPPQDDGALVRLADELNVLEGEVRGK